MADGEGRVVVTKDRDFRDGHLLSGSPWRLLIVATGNIANGALLGLFEANLDAVVGAPGTVRGWLGEPDVVAVIDTRSPAEFETVHLRAALAHMGPQRLAASRATRPVRSSRDPGRFGPSAIKEVWP